MPVVTPTAAAFKLRYPSFTNVDDALIYLVIAEASGAVSEGWAIADQQPGILAYAAHLLTLDGYGGIAVEPGDGNVDVAGPVSAVEVGDVKTTFSTQGRVRYTLRNAAEGSLADTVYGRRYLDLRRRNVAAVVVA
ncbi:DUF4054 domain-containing protein [Roseiarcaceae bacterium H3SJ34-1]|uniref:DUF4054 domain-containing protein n=1 Tax=Terripilifer ovatus TaxID=3032367 RepID=UPI003AB99157|nr:DUF4054 domain-containing protein [Roseiarcaceae bacterium H3SJ34-1]